MKENSPVVITGRLSIRDEKEPQIVINRARPISDFADGNPEPDRAPSQPQGTRQGTLYLKLTGEADPNYRKVRAIVNMFPGNSVVKVFFADTRKMRGAQAELDERMLLELEKVLGRENVVIK